MSAAHKRSTVPRLLPALMVTLGVMLSLRAVAVAEAAGQPQTTSQPTSPEQSKALVEAPPAAAQPNPASCPTGLAAASGLSPAEVQVLQSLAERRKQLEAREAALDTKAELAGAAERRLNERLEELKRLETRVQDLLGQVDEEQARRLATLVDVYQRMRAKDAASVFDALDENVLIEVAARMRQQNLAEIMARMNPERARALTVKLAETRLPPATTPPGSAPPRKTPNAPR
jgi:flagellar motility protein MotE (MotC chaperone)